MLFDAVAAVGADTPRAGFAGPLLAGWWLRRRLYETVVHHADAAIALGAPYALDPEVAADGISEWLSLGVALPLGESPLAGDDTLHLHVTEDLGDRGEWIVRPGVEWAHGHAKATTAVVGTAVDLFLVLMRRLAPDGHVEVFGDRAVLDTWLSRTSV
ncbi:uncharacterized protein (TIGR03083 family) [Actinokineospora auranticolor]|uniref:Uncharacterized protein (TIGR03083 family) n=1 Tax=Actinokineospora auranticolor TaxID=155976 RepID=A0A2S6GML7_9PSEU|nr:uncharacterized protein (TIGR03083 family) [Actinokineospora auranticolor]